MVQHNLTNQLFETSTDGLAVINSEGKVYHNNFQALLWLPKLNLRDLFNEGQRVGFGHPGAFFNLDPSPFAGTSMLIAYLGQEHNRIVVCIKVQGANMSTPDALMPDEAAQLYVSSILTNQSIASTQIEKIALKKKQAENAVTPQAPFSGTTSPANAALDPFYGRSYDHGFNNPPTGNGQSMAPVYGPPTYSQPIQGIQPPVHPTPQQWGNHPAVSQPFKNHAGQMGMPMPPAQPSQQLGYGYSMPIGTPPAPPQIQPNYAQGYQTWAQYPVPNQASQPIQHQPTPAASTPTAGTTPAASPILSAAPNEEYAPAFAELALGMAQLGAYRLDIGTKTTQWTADMYTLLGLPKSEKPGFEAFERYIHTDHRKAVMGHIHKSIQEGDGFGEVFFYSRPGESAICSLELSGKIERDLHGNALHIVGLLKDVTYESDTAKTLKAEKEALEQVSRELNEFNAVVGQDLKRPLANMVRTLSKIEEELGPLVSPQNQGEFDELRSRCQQMSTLVEGMITYSRALKGAPEPEWIDTEELLAEALRDAKVPSFVKVELPEVWPSFYQDAWRMKQMLVQIISNAYKFNTTDRPIIRVNLHPHGDGLLWTITDNGPGIPAESREKVFDLFYTLNNKRQTTGIGLAVVKKLVMSMGGTVELTAKEQSGTTVTLKLPGQLGPSKPKQRKTSASLL